jgi:hypothetical protein
MPLKLPGRCCGKHQLIQSKMKIERLNLKGIKNALNKDELKKIMAGSGTGTGTGGTGCTWQCTPQTLYCHDSTGYILGTVSEITFCSYNVCALPVCQEHYGTTHSVTGSIC